MTDLTRFPDLDAVADLDLRERLRGFFVTFDALDRENTHLRLKMQDQGCPYGHAVDGQGCALGYPGCACMDDLMAMASWSPEDEDKAAVRLGRRLQETTQLLDTAQQTLVGAALVLEAHHCEPDTVATCRQMAARRVSVPPIPDHSAALPQVRGSRPDGGSSPPSGRR
jgi:hypothetical protein